MATKLKRHLKKKIDDGTDVLPDELAFLANVNYFAITQQRVQYIREWYVEIKATSLKTLLDSKKKLNAARSANRQLIIEISDLQIDKAALEKNLKEIAGENARLAVTIKDQKKSQLVVEDAKTAQQEWRKEKLDLTEKMTALAAVNKQLLANMSDDNRQRQKKGTKNFFTEMQERGQLPTGPAIQGGSGGSNKR